MLKTLIKIRLTALFKATFSSEGKTANKPIIKLLFVLLMVYAFGAIGFSFFAMFGQICMPMYNENASWLYFALTGILAFCFGFIGSVFAAKAQLFEAKDNELMLSMPIPPMYILISRTVPIILLTYVFEALMVIPSGIVYCLNCPVSLFGIIVFIVSFLAMPLLVMTLSLICGWLIALLTAKARNRNIITMIISLAFFGAYFLIYGRMSSYIGYIITNVSYVAEVLKTRATPFYLLGKAISEGNLIYMLIFVVLCVALFVVAAFVLSRSYIGIMTANRKVSRKAYVEKEIKASGAFKALKSKEIRFFIGRPMYMMNSGVGLILMVVAAVAVIVKKDMLVEAVASMSPVSVEAAVSSIICLALCLCLSMVTISAPSLSLEGKNLWIPKSIPVSAKTILDAKIAAHIEICLPFSLISSLIACIAFRPSFPIVILTFILPLTTAVFSAVFGMTANLRFPRFDWINEITVIKQSMSVFIAMFGSFAIIGLPAMACIALMFTVITNPAICLLLFEAFLLLITGLSYLSITRSCEKRFASFG